MDIEKLNIGIIAYLLGSTNDFHTAIGNEFYFIENPNADKDVKYPYGIFEIIAGVPSRDSLTKYEEPIVQFTFYSNTLSSLALLQLGKKFMDRFDDCEKSLSIDGCTVISVDRITEPRLLKNDSGNEFTYWQYSVDYKIYLQRT